VVPSLVHLSLFPLFPFFFSLSLFFLLFFQSQFSLPGDCGSMVAIEASVDAGKATWQPLGQVLGGGSTAGVASLLNALDHFSVDLRGAERGQVLMRASVAYYSTVYSTVWWMLLGRIVFQGWMRFGVLSIYPEGDLRCCMAPWRGFLRDVLEHAVHHSMPYVGSREYGR